MVDKNRKDLLRKKMINIKKEFSEFMIDSTKYKSEAVDLNGEEPSVLNNYGNLKGVTLL